jgi:hypothetical protein
MHARNYGEAASMWRHCLCVYNKMEMTTTMMDDNDDDGRQWQWTTTTMTTILTLGHPLH